MCIAVLSTAHPAYRLILVDNRDEYLNRPTAKAEWWPSPNSDVLGGRDLLRSAQGTWLGVTKHGKIAVLTNFREETPPAPDATSRGAIIRKWLTEDIPSTSDFVDDVIQSGTARDAGGFTLICGHVDEKLAVVSNRAMDRAQVPWICGDVVQTIGVSNTAFTDHSWKKVTDAEEFMLRIIQECVRDAAAEDVLIEKLLQMLSTDSLKRLAGGLESNLDTYIKDLRNTILVPALGRKDVTALSGDEIAAAKTDAVAQVVEKHELKTSHPLGASGLYGTQKQTVILVGQDSRVRFLERTLFDGNLDVVPIGQGDVDYEFMLSPSKL